MDNLGLKFAVTTRGPTKFTTQDPRPVHAPLQPVNKESADGWGDRRTFVPSAKLAEQVLPQLIPAGLLEMLPVPRPVRTKAKVGSAVVKAGVASLATAQPPGKNINRMKITSACLHAVRKLAIHRPPFVFSTQSPLLPVGFRRRCLLDLPATITAGGPRTRCHCLGFCRPS